jgi:hypothetical protein
MVRKGRFRNVGLDTCDHDRQLLVGMPVFAGASCFQILRKANKKKIYGLSCLIVKQW